MKREDIYFRDEEPGDQEFLYRLYEGTRAQEMVPVPWDAAQKESFLRSQFQLQSAHYRKHYPSASFFLILDRDRPIGRLYVDRSPESIHILDISVISSRRGEGIGGALLRELLEEGEKSHRKVTLYAETLNPAQRLYRRLGFRALKDEGIYQLLEWSGAAEALAPGHDANSGE